MMESLRIFGILLYKSWLVRKKQIVGTVFKETVVPIALVALIWSATGSFRESPQKIDYDSHYEIQSWDDLFNTVDTTVTDRKVIVFVTPPTDFIDSMYDNCLDCKEQFEFYSCSNEDEMILEYYNYIYYDRSEYIHYTSKLRSKLAIGIVFDKPYRYWMPHLGYKLRYLLPTEDLYNDKRHPKNMTNFYTSSQHIAQLQLCIDRTFVIDKMRYFPKRHPIRRLPDMYIQQMPYPAHTKSIPSEYNFRHFFTAMMYIAYIFPLFAETSKSSAEKFSGVHVLMSMNGISNTLNLLSWILSGVVLLSIIFVLPIFLMLTNSSGNGLAFMQYGNSFILYIILIFYLIHLLTFGIHVSAYFSRATLVTIAITISTVVEIVLKVDGFNDSTIYLAPYLGILFPGILFICAFEEIIKYELKVEGIHWYNLFMNANPHVGIGGSIGMILILFMIGWIFHFSLAIYVYAIHPGKYGVAKDPLFCLKFKNEENNKNYEDDMENFEYDDANSQFFESTPSGVYTPGVQIRKLKKSYDASLFSKEKVHALRGVSIDFYKGQITSLLGHNGAGKTTMMSIITGMTSPSDGSVLINGKNLKDNALEIMNDMGLCPQMDMYFSNLTVSEQLTFFAMLKRKDKSRKEIRDDVADLLQKLRLSDKADAMPNTLSGGQKRRVCLGMSLVGDPSILILDEPTSGLDPETRRLIWDVLLKMRGEKTILISTHNMEEADILGDRIAIMHTGQLKSYGTSLFLKKMIGRNSVEITLSIDPGSDPEEIRSFLNEDGIIVSSEPGKIVVRIPNSPELPDTLDNLEKSKEELRVTGFSVILTSLEQVFLKMTEDDYDAPEPRPMSEVTVLSGNALHIQTVLALLLKKVAYARKDYHTMFVKYFTIILAMGMCAIIMHGIDKIPTTYPKNKPIGLHMYSKADVLYTTSNKSIGDQYKIVSKRFKGNPIEVTGKNLESTLLSRARDDLATYENHMIAAAELSDTKVNAFYSQTAVYSLPISINLVSNVIAKCMLGDAYFIRMSVHGWPQKTFLSYLDTSIGNSASTSFLFTAVFCATVALYVRQPARETASGFKQLQMMTGVSGFFYWGTMFIIDMLDYILIVFFVMVSFLVIDSSMKLQLYGPTEIAIHVLLFILFGINALLFMYSCSFLNIKDSSLVSLLTYVPMGLVTMHLMMYLLSLYKELNGNILITLYPTVNVIIQLLPHVSFFHAQMSFLFIAFSNARCLRLPNDFFDNHCQVTRDTCCNKNMKCYNGKCEELIPYFEETYFGHLEKSLTYLILSPILYIVILIVLESRLISKFFVKLKNIKSQHYTESNDDEQVEREKSMVYERIKMLNSNTRNNDEETDDTEHLSENPVFLVYELQKSYKNVKAVKDASFGVNRGECFGLLGVNGAGKSTTFKMMTGAELPDRGVMYIGDKDFNNHEKQYLSQITYCPQNDALLDNLNSYQHLKLFALLRGIAKDQIDNEVESWVERLNLIACASQPSGTYSGGNKRRLNIAIALIGNPNLILMDEPTTGVDPRARRSLWNVIKSCQMFGETFILASHSMEECEALCNRLTIMAAGKLVCIGPSEELKQRFGAGYDIQMKLNPEKATDQVDAIKGDMEQALRCELVDENMNYLMYHVEATGTTWREMYDVMNAMNNKYDCIEDFSVLSSTLEQLFLLFAKTADGIATVR